MKFAYLVCFVALLQFSCLFCMPAEETEPSFDSSTEANTTFTEFPTSETDSTPTVQPEITTEANATNGTTDNEEVESLPYTDTPDSSSVTAKESTTSSTTAKPSPGQAALVYPTALAVIVPVCIRLFSTNLVGVV